MRFRISILLLILEHRLTLKLCSIKSIKIKFTVKFYFNCIYVNSLNLKCLLNHYNSIFPNQGSSVHGVLQVRILEWIAISFSRGSSRPRYQTQVSRIVGRRFSPLNQQGTLIKAESLAKSSIKPILFKLEGTYKSTREQGKGPNYHDSPVTILVQFL